MGFLLIAYWIGVLVLLLVGLIKLIAAAVQQKPYKPGLKILLVGIVLLVIGAGACAAMIGGLSIG